MADSRHTELACYRSETISAVNVMEILLAPDARMEFAPTVRATVMPTSFLSVFAATVKVSALAVMV